MQSPRRNHRAKRSRWAHVNTPDGLRRRRAIMDARREAIAAKAPPAYTGPEPLSLWQEITIRLFVPACEARCDKHAVELDGERIGLLSASQIAERVRRAILKRPSVALLAEIRRDEWIAANS